MEKIKLNQKDYIDHLMFKCRFGFFEANSIAEEVFRKNGKR